MTDHSSKFNDPRWARNIGAVAAHMAAQSEKASEERASGDGASTGRFWQILGRLGPIGVGLAFVLGKFKWVAALLKFAKLKTLLTMIASIWLYGQVWGLPFAVGFVLLIFVHELGHAIALRWLGIPAGAPVFIPFVGAFIAMKGRPKNVFVEALVGIGGPILGTVGALICLVVGWVIDAPFWFALASTGFLLNLFNMLPIPPLDGGRIAGAVHRWLWGIGLIFGVAFFIRTHSPLLFLILLFGVFTFFRMFGSSEDPYFEINPLHRAVLGLAYFGLIGVMLTGMWIAESKLSGIVLTS